MKIVILTCIWKRPKITKIFLEQFKVLQNFSPEEFQVELVVVGSESNSKALITPFTKHYIHHDNLPVGKKWNAGLKYCEELDFDYLLALGSDDIISTSALGIYKRYAEEGFDYLGVQDFYLINTVTKRMKYWRGYEGRRSGESVGAGRMFSKKLLERLDFILWSNLKNRGLDSGCERRVKTVDHTKINIRAKNNQVFLVDLKSRINIGGYEKCKGNPVTMKRIVVANFSNKIYKMIKSLN